MFPEQPHFRFSRERFGAAPGAGPGRRRIWEVRPASFDGLLFPRFESPSTISYTSYSTISSLSMSSADAPPLRKEQKNTAPFTKSVFSDRIFDTIKKQSDTERKQFPFSILRTGGVPMTAQIGDIYRYGGKPYTVTALSEPMVFHPQDYGLIPHSSGCDIFP